MCCNFVGVMKLYPVILSIACAAAVNAVAQENVQVNVTPGNHKLDQPVLSVPVTPSGGLSTSFPAAPMVETPGFEVGNHGLLDSVAVLSADLARTGDFAPSGTPRFDFRHDYNSRNWARNGIIATGGGGYLVGQGGFTAMPGLGDIGSASLSWVQPLGDRLTVSAGVMGNKYHLDRDAWNDYGAFANARLQLSGRFALMMWGSYYVNARYHSMAAMPCLPASNYGAALEMMASDDLGLRLGAERYLDPYSGRWRVKPVVAPVINVLGTKMAIDFGGLVGNWFESKSRKNQFKLSPDQLDPSSPRDGYMPAVPPPVPPGFNKYSPVRVPDALRH